MSFWKPKPKRPLMVAIFGSGPAGLFAAQAAYDTGNVVQIYARGERSPLHGAQYLHEPIPGLTIPPMARETVSYILKGTVDGYRRKVYGSGSSVTVSPDALAPHHDAWDIRATYENAWERFQGLIQPTEITPAWLDSQGRIIGADLVVWGIPLASACVGGHQFLVQSVWAQGDAPELGLECSVTVEPWTVIVNGEDSPRWYRASNVFGHRTAEWPDGPRPPIKGIARVNKPIRTLCSCWLRLGDSPVLRVGRYGTWTKGEYSHQAYTKTRTVLESMR
jgi:hypothetical protein